MCYDLTGCWLVDQEVLQLSSEKSAGSTGDMTISRGKIYLRIQYHANESESLYKNYQSCMYLNDMLDPPIPQWHNYIYGTEQIFNGY
jgi:hypothetical protein